MLCWVVVMALVPLTAGAQETTSEKSTDLKSVGGLRFIDEYDLTVVNIDAYVTDKKGNPVTDLKAEDFKVYQDGGERVISNFKLFTKQTYSTAAQLQYLETGGDLQTAPKLDETAEEEIRPAWIVIYVDNANLHALSRNRVLKRVNTFVRENLNPPVQMMVVSFLTSFKVMQPFTSDKQEVIAALNEMHNYQGGYEDRRSAHDDALDRMHEEREENKYGSSTSMNAGDTIGFYNSYLYNLMANAAKEAANDLSYTIDALRGVVTKLSGLPGKKAILYISDGLPMIPGLDLFYEYAELYQDGASLNMVSRFDRTDLFSSLVASANAQGVTIHTIGARGLRVLGSGSASQRYARSVKSASTENHNLIDTLKFVADNTGGIAVVNTNDFTGGLEKIARDLYTYYSLGYSLVASGEDKVHSIRVELPNHPDYELRYRHRFVEKSLETRVQDKVLSGLMFDIEDNPMQLYFTAGNPSPASNDLWTLPVHLSFPIRKVALLPLGSEYVGNVVVFFGARDEEGKQSDFVRQEHEVRVPIAQYNDAQRQRFGIDANLLLDDGRYKILVALLDPVTRQSSYKGLNKTIYPAD